jgi:peptidoglycan/xylan/chitin deacetylase (PgdA/CDA1 family)
MKTMKICVTVDAEKDPDGTYAGLVNGLPKLLAILDKKMAKATFFVTSNCLKTHPGIFRELKRKGHEIALHGFMHERWDVLSVCEKEERLDKAIEIYKKILKEDPKGFRAPQFSADFNLIRLLEERGFTYDSSIVQFPLSQAIFFPSRFPLYLEQCKFMEKIKKQKMKIKEIPVSSFILPISAFSLRKLPFPAFSALARLSSFLRKDNTVVFLSHSYEFNDKNIKKLEKFLSAM